MLHVLIIILRILMLLFCLYGYVQKLKEYIQVNFIPMVLFSFISITVFICGLLNILQLSVFGIIGVGVFLAIKSILKHESFKKIISCGIIAITILAFLELLFLFRNEFTGYDNFSHWALVVKQMIINNRFPNFQDTIIQFQDYPLGSASFIYFIVKSIGLQSEWVFMYSQAILLLSIVPVLFAFVKKNKIINYIIIIISYIFIIGCNISLNNLLVDTLLPLVGAGSLLYAVYYKKDLEKHIPIIILLTCFCIIIKNSGFFFAIITWIYCLYILIKNKCNWKKIITIPAIPMFISYLWKAHVKFSFVASETSKHSMNLNYYQNILLEKDDTIINSIFEQIKNVVFSLDNKFVFCLVGIIILIIIIKLFYKKNKLKISPFLLLILIYILYLIGIFAMYIFSMPNYEALILAGYNRYHLTILIYIIFILNMLIIDINNKNKRVFSALIISSLFIVISFLTLNPATINYKKQNILNSQRDIFNKLIWKYSIPKQQSYIVLVENDPYGYIYYMSRYLLNSDKIKIVSIDKISLLEDYILNYDYLIVFNNSTNIKTHLLSNYNITEQVVRLKKD